MDNNNVVRCNDCMEVFYEEEIVYDFDTEEETCLKCGKVGCLMDMEV